MKKWLSSSLLILSVIASACWIEIEPPVSTPDYELRLDGRTVGAVMTLALPAQLDLKFLSDADTAILQYRAEGVENWTTLRTLGRGECRAAGYFVPVFGRRTFRPEMMGEAGRFQFRIQVIRGVYQSFSLSDPDAGAKTVTIATNRRPE